MSFDIDKLAEKTANLSIDPVFDTNWCDMPAEIKLECIGKMEFKERLSLRCTAKAERSLVDTQKIEFFRGSLYRTSAAFDYDKDDTHFVSLSILLKNKIKFLKGFQLMNYIWKVGVFENFTISAVDPAVKQELLNYTGRISAKNIELRYFDNETLVTVLQKIEDGVKSIMINCAEENDYNINEILANPQIQSVRYWHLLNYSKTDSLFKVSQMWIDKKMKVGSAFQILCERPPSNASFEEFSKHFVDRIVSKSDKRVRIRTNNSDRHILLERGLNETVGTDYYWKWIHLTVISAEVKESEYGRNCEKWIRRMAPLALKEFGDRDNYDD